MSTADVYRALWRQKYFILLLTGVLVAVAWYLTSRQTPIYQASTLVRVQQTATTAEDDAYRALVVGERLAQTYARIVETRQLDRRVQEALSRQLPTARIDFELSAEPIESLELLVIRARSPSAEQATVAANAVPPAIRTFIRETGTLRDRIVPVDAATQPRNPISPNLTLNLAVALLLGLIFNGALALLIEVLSDRLPDTDELEASLKLPVLGTIPTLALTRSEDRGSGREVPQPGRLEPDRPRGKSIPVRSSGRV
jgi:capsular polysaccharide biosynthesis protein